MMERNPAARAHVLESISGTGGTGGTASAATGAGGKKGPRSGDGSGNGIQVGLTGGDASNAPHINGLHKGLGEASH